MTAMKQAACSKAAVRQPVAQTSSTVHMMAPDERRRRRASDADLHVSERDDGAHEYCLMNGDGGLLSLTFVWLSVRNFAQGCTSVAGIASSILVTVAAVLHRRLDTQPDSVPADQHS